jgi:myo-inositol-1(or 4)-monophosphatase
MTVDVAELEDVAERAATAAGVQLMHFWRGRQHLQISEKTGAHDLVSDADQAADRAVRSVISRARPQDGLLTEETGRQDGSSSVLWVVDPLDGTHNFVYGLDVWCVSVAALVDGVAAVGVIYDPVRDEVFCAAADGTLTVNGAQVAARRRTRDLKGSVLAGTWGRTCTLDHPRQARLAGALCPNVGQVRLLGSTALMLAWTAAGRCDAFYGEAWLHEWDVAAGLLMCGRAGLQVLDFDPAAEGLPRRLLVCDPALSGPLTGLIG